MIDAGRVGRPHGLDGSFHVTRAVAELIAATETVEIDGRAVRIERRAGTAERPILRLEGCTSREDGEELVVPMVADAVRSIDAEAKRIDVDLGFLGAD